MIATSRTFYEAGRREEASASSVAPEHRGEPRYTLDAPYTLVRVKRKGRERFSLLGHAYDVSVSGVRFELDVALPVGELIEMELILPAGGQPQAHIRACGRIVRWHDIDEVGPIRVAVAFTEVDRAALERYLARHAVPREAAQRLGTGWR